MKLLKAKRSLKTASLIKEKFNRAELDSTTVIKTANYSYGGGVKSASVLLNIFHM